jgi:hypothetical protein
MRPFFHLASTSLFGSSLALCILALASSNANAQAPPGQPACEIFFNYTTLDWDCPPNGSCPPNTEKFCIKKKLFDPDTHMLIAQWCECV